MNQASIDDGHQPMWILDSRVTSHICHNLSFFNSYIILHDKHITLRNNSIILVTTIGVVPLNTSFQITNMLFLLEFHVNLIFVNALLKQPNFSF
ncbi:hypothetical protein CR513_46214, partial [Mucuna pruriens]